MKIIGCDLHAAQQTIAMLDRETGEVSERTLEHTGDIVREFYSSLPAPVVVGIEATGSMGWFLRLMEELRISCQVGEDVAFDERVGRPHTPTCCHPPSGRHPQGNNSQENRPDSVAFPASPSVVLEGCHTRATVEQFRDDRARGDR